MIGKHDHHSIQFENYKIYENIHFFRFRGTLLSFFDPFMNLGTASAFVLAKYLDYNDQAKCHLIMVILFVILFARIPESPQHLIDMQRPKVRILISNNTFFSIIFYFRFRTP